jgi:hypothetical protein
MMWEAWLCGVLEYHTMYYMMKYYEGGGQPWLEGRTCDVIDAKGAGRRRRRWPPGRTNNPPRRRSCSSDIVMAPCSDIYA